MSQGFSDAAIRVYEPKILDEIEIFCRALVAEDVQSEKVTWTAPQNMSAWCNVTCLTLQENRLTLAVVNYLAFDMMSSVVFSASFNTTTTDEYRYVPKAIEESNIRMSVILQAKELTLHRLDRYLFPASITARNRSVKFISALIGTRLQDTAGSKHDIFDLLQNAKDPQGTERLATAELGAEAATLVVAGKLPPPYTIPDFPED